MMKFRYKAASQSGEVLEGVFDAESEKAVVQRIQAQGHVPILVEKARPASKKRSGWSWARFEMRSRDADMFCIELATLLKAGLALSQALETLADMLKSRSIGEVVQDIQLQVRKGERLSSALKQHPKVFTDMDLSIVHTGEVSGNLTAALERIASFRERAREVREALVSALIYPMILLVFAGISLVIILGVVIPKISVLFANAGHELPVITQMVVHIGEFIRDWWWIGLTALLSGVFYLRWRLKMTTFRMAWDRRLLTIPFLGIWISKYETARFARILGTLLQSGMALLAAVEVARDVVANANIKSGISRVITEIRQGRGFSTSLLNAGVFPKLATDLLQVGEKTGSLDEMLLQVAHIYERDTQSQIKRIMSVLSPLLILFLAVLIGTIVMSVLVAVLGVNELAF